MNSYAPSIREFLIKICKQNRATASNKAGYYSEKISKNKYLFVVGDMVNQGQGSIDLFHQDQLRDFVVECHRRQ